MQAARAALCLVVMVTLGRMVTLYHQLPDRVPSHFDAAGRADNWSGRGEFLALFAVIVLLIAGIFLATGYLMRKLPIQYINLPNRNYWLSEDRRPSTLQDLDSRMLWMGVASVAWMAFVLELSVNAAQGDAETLSTSSLLVATGLYIVVLSWQSWSIYSHYNRIPE